MGLAAIGVGAYVIVHVTHLAVLDRGQQQWLVLGLASGDIGGVFDGTQTSGPGVGLFTVPTYLLVRTFAGQSFSYDAASLTCLLPLAASVVAVSRSLGTPARSRRELLNVAVVVLGMPTLAAYVEAFHPADVLATAAVLGSVAAIARGRLGWAMVLLGFAVATRQWAVVPVVVIAVLLPRDERSRLLLGSIGVAVVLIMPFFLANPSQTASTLMARDVVSGQLTAAGLVPVSNGFRYLFARYLPLVLAGLWCAWLLRRKVSFSTEIALGAVGAAMLMRALVDPAGFVYYLGPAYACCVLLGPRSCRWPLVGAAAGLVVWVRHDQQGRYPSQVFEPRHEILLTGAVLSGLTTLAIAAATIVVIRHTVSLADARSVGEPGSAGQAPPGRPGDAEAGDRVLG